MSAFIQNFYKGESAGKAVWAGTFSGDWNNPDVGGSYDLEVDLAKGGTFVVTSDMVGKVIGITPTGVGSISSSQKLIATMENQGGGTIDVTIDYQDIDGNSLSTTVCDWSGKWWSNIDPNPIFRINELHVIVMTVRSNTVKFDYKYSDNWGF